MSSEHPPIRFNEDGRPFGVFEGGAQRPMLAAKMAEELIQRKVAGDADAGDIYRRIQATFDAKDALALPDDMAYGDVIDELGVVNWLAMMYAFQDEGAIRQFCDFMAERHDSHEAALRRDLPDVKESMYYGFASLEGLYPEWRQTQLGVLGAYRRLGVRAISSFEAGIEGVRGLCAMDPMSATSVGLANGYSDPVNYQGLDVDFLRTWSHEGDHAANADLQAGFMFGIDEPRYMPMIEELGAELAARMSVYGKRDLEEVLKTTRGSYSELLEFFDALTKTDANGLTLPLLFEARSSVREHNSAGSPRHELRQRFDVAIAKLLPEYAEGGIAQVSDTYKETPDTRRAEFVSDLTRTAIKSAYGLQVSAGTDPHAAAVRLLGLAADKGRDTAE